MQKPGAIDYARLLGFASVTDQLSGNVDFQDESIGAMLGAKVGDKTWAACDLQCGSHSAAEEPSLKAPPSHSRESDA